MDRELRKHFMRLLIYSSLDAKQLNHLGQMVDSSFDIFKESGFGTTIPIPRQSAAETIVQYFDDEEAVVQLFGILLRNEGTRFYNANLMLHDADTFITFLGKRKWVYDKEVKLFFRDPFFEHEINFLKSIRIIDLRRSEEFADLITQISEAAKRLGDKDLEWSVNLRLYDLNRESSRLILEILNMLLVRQNLQEVSFDLFTCLKELAINASKANYKQLYERLVTAPQGITAANSYSIFLQMFKNEIAENGNKNLLELAQKKDRYINITFQSTNDKIGIWVTNSQNITPIEKEALLKKLGYKKSDDLFALANDDELNEGAGLGIHLVLSLLRQYSNDPIPLKVVFYPSYVKVGFLLNRDTISDVLSKKEDVVNE